MTKAKEAISHLQQVPLFSACSKRELEMILGATTELRFQAGDVLAKEGAAGHEFMVIVEGEVVVEAAGRTLAKLGAGDFFGEVALLDGGPRTATVTAVTAVVAEVISQGEFKGLLSRAPGLDQKLLVGLARRLREADLRLTQ